ncbi:unnamed protein product, partial [Timema podura]|nr:unnamed protein product [Timema podura]
MDFILLFWKAVYPTKILPYCRWIIAFLRKGYKKDLEEKDLYTPLKNDHSKIIGDKLEKAWSNEHKNAIKAGRAPRLSWTLVKTFAWELVYLGFINLFCNVILRLAQPLILSQLLRCFHPNHEHLRDDAYLYAGALVANMALTSLLNAHYMQNASHLALRVKTGCCSLIYRKVSLPL